MIQQAGLFPHKTIIDNIATVPLLLGQGKRRARALDLLKRVGLPAEVAGRYPAQLSGGQRQRVGGYRSGRRALMGGAADDTGMAGGLATGSGRCLGGPDDETAEWLSALGGTGPTREQALARLHGLLLRIARAELGRRAGRHPITGPELDDVPEPVQV